MGPSCHGPAVLLLCQDAHPSLGDVTERGTFLEPPGKWRNAARCGSLAKLEAIL